MRNKRIFKNLLGHICKFFEKGIAFPKAIFFVQNLKIFYIKKKKNKAGNVYVFIVHFFQRLTAEIMHIGNTSNFITNRKLKKNTLGMLQFFVLLGFL